MTAHRLLATTALLAGAVLALTACDPDGSAPAAQTSATASTAPTASAAPTASPTASAGTAGTASPTATKAGKPATPTTGATKAAPTPDCTAAAQHPGHKVINATSATATGLNARATRFVCGPQVDNDGYWEAVGSFGPYTFAAGATAELVTMTSGVGSAGVPLSVLVQHVNDCAAHREPPAPYNCFGGTYDITVDGAGHITRISELYHP
ncbi:hypothetical protein GCM10010441_47260 [Kitasatospora paracochleata]|uniref:Cytoskeletal protein RodZ n=1 Tax=Kitasatospora paracochleata TaxID=58354 RepID=A0ABT1J6K7_9ACTN|nr:hypothetical protein [Kitasatospora paracochleata]MCP2312859.1 cytoskeletal protein RodZ [Kitasatospora paracochleata]